MSIILMFLIKVTLLQIIWITGINSCSSFSKLVIIVTEAPKIFHSHLWKSQQRSTEDFLWKSSNDSMIGALLIVLPFFKNSFRPACDMTCFTDICIKTKWTEHKRGIKYFHCKKYRNFTWFPGMEILQRGTGRLVSKIRGIALWNLVAFPPLI